MNWQDKTEEILNKRTAFISEPDLFFILKMIKKENPKYNANGIHYLSILNNCSQLLINQAIDQLIYLEYLTTDNNEFTITEKGINVLGIYAQYFMI
jgi:predicted transcriptional regulator